MCIYSELTQVWSDQRHRVEVGELHVLGQILGVLLQQLRQLGRTAARDVVLTLSESSPQSRGTRTQQHAAAPHNVLQKCTIRDRWWKRFLKYEVMCMSS